MIWPTNPMEDYWGKESTATVLWAITDERDRQDNIWGQQDGDDKTWLPILAEEFGEVARAMLQQDGEASGNLREELVQVAAVCVAWVEAIDRRE